MIRGEAMREKIKSLWKLCFNDSDEFKDMYFRLRYSNEVNIAIQSGEEVIAALQILPCFIALSLYLFYHLIASTGCSFKQATYFSRIMAG